MAQPGPRSYALGAILLLLIVSGVITRALARDSRRLEGPRLADLSAEEVSFVNDKDGLLLRGLLFLPAGREETPAVVIIHGSGTSRRDSRWYLALSSYLHEQGIAVLLPDKRGSERSEGNWRTASFAQLAEDALAGVRFLREYGGAPFSTIGVIGMSQGGQIAPLAAVRSADIDFVVSLSGSGVPLRSQLVFEENHNLRQMGVPPILSNILAYPAAWSIVYLRQREFWSAVGNPDALPYWTKLDVPALILLGSDDTNVPARRSARRLRAVENANLRIQVYEGSGHAIEDPPEEGNQIIRREALEDVAGFILKVAQGT